MKNTWKIFRKRVQLAWMFARGRRWWTMPAYFVRTVIFGFGHKPEWAYRALRWLEGARPVKIGTFEETSGTFSAPGVEIEFGGACPVQGDGEVDGQECYYRSRGEGWQFHVACEGDVFDEDAWEYFERVNYFPDAGWVHRDVTMDRIARAVSIYRQQQSRNPGST